MRHTRNLYKSYHAQQKMTKALQLILQLNLELTN